MTVETKFSGIMVRHWRQFRSVDLRFSPGVNILTGRNGTGKTTVLNLLAQHSAYHSNFIGSPAQSRDSKGRYTSGTWREYIESFNKAHIIGEITYSDGGRADIVVPADVNVDFAPQLVPMRPVNVLNISSHRRLPSYKKVESIPTEPITGSKALESYQQEVWSALRGGVSRLPPLTRMKEALVSMAVFGWGNERVGSNLESYGVFKEFEERLAQLIPENIGFKRIIVEVPNVLLETSSGRFLIDASSGGLMSLIDLAWQITLYGLDDPSFVVIIDEPENHLHPSMQREFLPALTSAFPNVQFIIATHSPFIVSSVRDAVVYAFDVDMANKGEGALADDLSAAKNAVVTTPVDLENRTSSQEVLRKVLGVPVTIPIWAERELDSIAEEFGGGGVSVESLARLRARLVEKGLDEFLPDAVSLAFTKNA